MLQNLSDKMSGLLAKTIIIFICAMFALWGIHYYLEESKTVEGIAKVNGVKITQTQFDAAYKRRQILLGADGQELLSDAHAANALKQATLEDLIKTQVLVQGAQKENLYVGSGQVFSLIQQTPIFKSRGQFSPLMYERELSMLGYTSEDFEDMVRTKMLINQVEMGIAQSTFALPMDMDNTLRLTEQQRNIRYALIPISSASLTSPITDAQIKAYYEEHKENYAIPEKVKLQYVELSLDELAKNATVSDEEIQTYYTSNSSSFAQQPLSAVKDKIKAQLAKREAEKDFSDFSDKLDNTAYENPNSLEPAAQAINTSLKETDYFSKQDKITQENAITDNPKVRSAAFSDEVLHEGYNSKVISVDDSTQVVIRLLNRQPSSYMPLSTVKDSIKETLTEQALADKVKAQGEVIKKALMEGATSDALAKQYNLQWKEENNISRDNKTLDPKILQTTFKIKPTGSTSAVDGIALQDGSYALVQVLQVTPGNINNITDAKRQELALSLERVLGSADYNLYYDSLKDKASVKVYTQKMVDEE